MFDFKKLDENITIEEYDENWSKWFDEEKENLKKVFGNKVQIEHYGSSAVPGLLAKPIVDILVGVKSLPIDEGKIKVLKEIGYEYFGQLHEGQQRCFARKRSGRNFNLTIVPYPSIEWDSHLFLRDYLRKHPKDAKTYSEIKQQALNQGKDTLIEYNHFKDEFVKRLLEKAQMWKM